MLMKEQILRHILTSMLLFLTLQTVGKRIRAGYIHPAGQ